MKKGLQIIHTESICQFEQQSISDSQLAKSLMGRIHFPDLGKRARRSRSTTVQAGMPAVHKKAPR